MLWSCPPVCIFYGMVISPQYADGMVWSCPPSMQMVWYGHVPPVCRWYGMFMSPQYADCMVWSCPPSTCIFTSTVTRVLRLSSSHPWSSDGFALHAAIRKHVCVSSRWKWRLNHENNMNSLWARKVLVTIVHQGLHDFLPAETFTYMLNVCTVLNVF